VVYDFQVQNLVSEVLMVDSIDFLNELNGEYFEQTNIKMFCKIGLFY
jgi:hypothetical protein